MPFDTATSQIHPEPDTVFKLLKIWREFAEIATETDPLYSESFVFLADLYLKALKICNIVKTPEIAAVYNAASVFYAKAGMTNESQHNRKKGLNY